MRQKETGMTLVLPDLKKLPLQRLQTIPDYERLLPNPWTYKGIIS